MYRLTRLEILDMRECEKLDNEGCLTARELVKRLYITNERAHSMMELYEKVKDD